MDSKPVGFFGFDDITASHLVDLADVFAAAALDGGYGNRIPCYRIYVIGLNPRPFQTDSGLVITPSATFQTAPELDTLIVAGGKGLRDSKVSEQISDWILTRVNRTRRIGAIGSGVYGLAPTGLLDGREVTTHWRFAQDVARRFPQLRLNHQRPVVKDGPFYTASGLAAGIDLSLSLIEEDYGRNVALAAAAEIGLTQDRNGNGEFPRPLQFDSQPTDRFADLVAWIMRHLNEDLSVNALARRAGMSPPHFARAFKSVIGSTPTNFVENLRVNEAKRRLSTPKNTLRTVAASVGFPDADAFRRAFERRLGIKPRKYLKTVDPNSAAICW